MTAVWMDAPPPSAWLHSPESMPRQLKRQWQHGEGSPQPTWASCQPQAAEAVAAEPQRQRRRLDGWQDAPLPFVATPQQAPQLHALPQQQQQQQQQQSLKRQWEPASDLDMDLEGSRAAGASSREAEQPARRRARTSTPGYRLMLPTPLPSAIPLTPAVAPLWERNNLHDRPIHPDAWAVVPYAAPLVPPLSQPAAVCQPDTPRCPQLQDIQIRELLAAAQGLNLTFDHEQPLPEMDTAQVVDQQIETPAQPVTFVELPMGGGGAGDEAMEE